MRMLFLVLRATKLTVCEARPFLILIGVVLKGSGRCSTWAISMIGAGQRRYLLRLFLNGRTSESASYVQDGLRGDGARDEGEKGSDPSI